MAYEFKLRRRVEFGETDMAGIVHFANFFRYMEITEHAFFRSVGFSVHMQDGDRVLGWPRVHVSCDFKSPLVFEDEFEIHLRVREKRSKALTYDFVFRKVGEEADTVVAHGWITSVCVARDEATGKMKAVPIPERFASQIEVAPPELLPAD